MEIIADLHIHSGYARACSKDLTLENIDIWCKKKGIDVVSVGDFTHPARFKEIKNNLISQNNGLYKFKGSNTGVSFLMGTEVSVIYSHGGKTRRVHHCIFLSSIESVEKFNKLLVANGAKLKADGRPILGMSSKKVLELLLEADEQGFLVPAHAWTPWFAIFGSKSGYDSIEECFEELSHHIKAIETGLSSDPPMNWRLSMLDNINLISNSDAHSLRNLGREGNIMEVDVISYDEIKQAVQDKRSGKLKKTIEFYPQEGMYHYDGHRVCGVSFAPAETRKKKGICPKCGKQLVLGVDYRVGELANRSEKDIHRLSDYVSIIPLQEIISETIGVGKSSKKVQTLYESMVSQGKSEFDILLNLNEQELLKFVDPYIVKAILKMRLGEVEIIPGFDGQYGVVKIFSDREKTKQKSLF